MADRDFFWNCAECGVRASMPESLNDWYRADARRKFFCVRGHANHYSNDVNDIEKIRRERDRLKQQTAMLSDVAREATEAAQHERARANGYKGFATRMKKRVVAGVCPCCNRTFQNLAQHMATQHKDELDKMVDE
jgi:hypothetical protein